MNRRQRRQMELHNNKKTAVYQYNEHQLRTKIDNCMAEYANPIRKETTKLVTNALFGIFAIALHDEMGFGKIRIGRILERCKNQFECLEKDYVKLDEILKECEQFKVKIDKI